MNTRLIELVVIMAAVITATLIPMFILASEVDGDEFVKAGAGILVGSVAAVLTTYRLWKGNKSE